MSSGLPSLPESMQGSFNLETCTEKDFVGALETCLHTLIEEFVVDTKNKYALPQDALDRLRKMFVYNCLGGKYWRAQQVMITVRVLGNSGKSKYSTADLSMASLVLGWCIEALQACFLVADDLMDGSITRRGKPCWYRQPDVLNDAVNDALILESFIYFLLRRYLKSHPNYAELVDLYHDVSLQTQLGQMLDLTAQPQGRCGPDTLRSFNIDVYHRIVKFKTSVYTFHLPYASALLLCGYDSAEALARCYEISVALGTKFQIEDDYLDCYGEPSKIGKIGTDIKDHKCSWLIVQCLKRATPEHMALLDAHYGKHDDESEAKVKALFNELNLKQVYLEQEESSYQSCKQMIVDASQLLPVEMFLPVLDFIHLREK